MYRKTEGIVLRETEYNDHDKLLTVLTRDLGKITVKARGARSQRSKLRAACQITAFSEITLQEYQGRYTLTEAVTKELFAPLQGDVTLLSLASYFLQVTEAVAPEEDPIPELLSLLLNSLYALSKLGKPQLLVKAVFELRLCSIIGFQPDLRGCVVCGNPNPDRINVHQGCLQCARCSGGEGLRLPLTAGLLEALRFITYGDAKKLFSFQMPEAALRELSGIAESYLCVRLERGFYTLDFYKSLFI
jgi:DNA repair protein RecO (recombination protein O)